MALLVVIVLSLLACSPRDDERSAKAGEELTMRIGEAIAVEDAGLEVRFEDVLRDSRCPPDVQCVRAGEAVVVLIVKSPESEATRLELEVPPGGRAETTHAGRLVRIVSLEPPASATRRLDRDDYVLVLVVES